MIKVYSMTAIMDLSFSGQRTATATLCIPHDSVYMSRPRAGKSENGFFRRDTWLQIFQNDSKICEAEVTVTPLINKICKPCNCVTHLVVFSLKYFLSGNYHSKLTLSDRIQGAKKVSLVACQLWASCRLHVLAQKPFQLAKKN